MLHWMLLQLQHHTVYSNSKKYIVKQIGLPGQAWQLLGKRGRGLPALCLAQAFCSAVYRNCPPVASAYELVLPSRLHECTAAAIAAEVLN